MLLSSVQSRTPNDCADLRTSRCMKAMSSIRSIGNRPSPVSHTHCSNRSSAPRPQCKYRTFHGRSPAKQRGENGGEVRRKWHCNRSTRAILSTRSQRLAGKRHHRCTPRTLDHSSPAALTTTAVILCRPAVSLGHRILPDQCRFPVPGPLAQFLNKCLFCL